MNIPPRLPHPWVDDQHADTCHACHAPFTLWNRKHHCRMCGCIFCHLCTPHHGNIPSYMQTYPTHDKVRLCHSCHNMCTQSERSDTLIRVFSLLGLAPQEMSQLAAVSKTWHHAATTVIGVYKGIPYKLSHARYSSLERNLMKTNAHRFGGHTCWAIQCARINLPVPRKRLHACTQLLCAPDCNEHLQPRHVLQLLCTFPAVHILRHRTLSDWIRNRFRRLDTDTHVHFMPWWTMLAKTSKIFTTQFLLPVCSDHKRIAYALYFECETEVSETLAKLQRLLVARIPKSWVAELRQTKRLILHVDEMILGNHTQCPVRPQYTIPMPYNPDVLCTGVGTPTQLSSATKPHVIPFHTNQGNVHILVKREDVRKDRYAMGMARMLHTLCGVRCVRYDVFCMRGRGWVVMLPALTLHALGTRLSAHVYNTYREQRVQDIRNTFIASTVGACILSYILGVGDRHLQNMVVSRGEIAHIDFSYLLGHDPKLAIDIRITQPMIDMMGGKDSPDYQRFLTLVQDAYNQSRKYTQFWYTAMQYLSDIQLYTRQEIKEHVQRKLMPGQLESTAATRIVDVVKHGSDSWRNTVADVTHNLFHMEL